MKRKQAKKYFNTDLWFDTNLTHLTVNDEKYNAKKGKIAKKYEIETSLLDYIVDDFKVFDKVQFLEQLEFANDKVYKNTFLKLLEDNVFSQFCESANLSLDDDIGTFEQEAIVWFLSLDENKLNDANELFDLSNLKLNNLHYSKAASYNDLFEIVNCKESVLFLMSMDAYIENDDIFIGKYSMMSGECKHNYFNFSPDEEFKVENTLLPNGTLFTKKNWKQLLK